MRLTDTAKKELQEILSMSRQQRDETINKYSNLLNKSNNLKPTDFKSIGSPVIYSSIVNLSKFYSNQKSKSEFIEALKDKGFERDQITTIGNFANKIMEIGISEKMTLVQDRLDLETFGIPHLANLNLTMDYRLLDGEKKKEVVPVVICEILVHDKRKRDPKDTQLVFQLSPENIEELINKLRDFQEKMNEEIDFVTDKLAKD